MRARLTPLVLTGMLMIFSSAYAQNVTYHAQLIDSRTGGPAPGIGFLVSAKFQRTVVVPADPSLSGPLGQPAKNLTGVTDASGNVTINESVMSIWPDDGVYVGPSPDIPYSHYYTYSFIGFEGAFVVTSRGFSSPTQSGTNSQGYPIYQTQLLTPVNENRITVTQNAINHLVQGLFRDNNPRYAHSISGTAPMGSGFNLNLTSPSVQIQPNGLASITINFQGTVTAYALSGNASGYFTVEGTVVPIPDLLNGGRELAVLFPFASNVYSWIHFTVHPSQFPESELQSMLGASIEASLTASGYPPVSGGGGIYVPIGNAMTSVCIGPLYAELEIPNSVPVNELISTTVNTSNPGLSTITCQLWDYMSYIGQLP